MKVAYWPGCVSRGFTPELHGSMAKVAPKLDIELVELDRANCCGAGVIAEHNQELADTLNARTFAMAQGVDGRRRDDEHLLDLPGRAVGVPGAARRRHRLPRAHQRQPRAPRASPTSATARGGTRTSSGCWSRRSASTRSASASSARSTACAWRRSTAATSCARRKRLGYADHPERDTYLEQVIEALGGTPVAYAGSHKCCGFPVITMNKETSLRQAGRHMADAIDAGADCVVTPCPLCHLNLDLQQPDAAKYVERDLGHAGAALPAARRASRSGSSRRSSG